MRLQTSSTNSIVFAEADDRGALACLGLDDGLARWRVPKSPSAGVLGAGGRALLTESGRAWALDPRDGRPAEAIDLDDIEGSIVDPETLAKKRVSEKSRPGRISRARW